MNTTISLWHATRKQPFDDATGAPPPNVDVLVVGAGITGITTALTLTETGRRVVVVDAAGVGAGTTGGTSAHLSCYPERGLVALVDKHGLEATAAVVQALRQGLDGIEALVKRHGLDASFARVDGHLYAERGQEEQIEEEARIAEQLGLEPRMQAPQVPFAVAKSMALPGQGAFHPLDYLDGLCRAAVAAGVTILTGVRVEEVGDEAEVAVTWRPTVGGEPGQIVARTVVLATHTPLGRRALHAALPGYRSYVLAGPTPRGVAVGLSWDSASPYHYLRQAQVGGEDYLVIGGADHKTGDGDEEQQLAALRAYARERFEGFADSHRWSAQLYEPTDALPVIDRLGGPGDVWVATGFSGDGLTWGTFAAFELARLMAEAAAQPSFPSDRVSLLASTELLKAGVDTARNAVMDRLAGLASPETAELPLGCGANVRHGTRNALAARGEDGTLRLMTATCPHMGGLLQYNALERTFDCPCHGARFDLEGRPVDGPIGVTLDPLDE